MINLLRFKRRAKLTIPVDEPVEPRAPKLPATPPALPGIQANRYEMSFTVVVGDAPALISGSPIVRDVAPIFTRFD